MGEKFTENDILWLVVLQFLSNLPNYFVFDFILVHLFYGHTKRLCPDLVVGLGARLRLQLHGAIYRPDTFVLILRYCANLKAMRYESTSFNKIAAEKSHRVIAA